MSGVNNVANAEMPEFYYTPAPQPDDVAALTDILNKSNAAAGWPDAGYEEFGYFLRTENGEAVGGISGYILYDWLFVQFLAVPERLRGKGIGGALMSRAERLARERGAIGMWLDTFEFGPADYYAKLGFTVVGAIEDHPAGSRRIFFQKRF
jgi:GNAT superfamily N-acetyltransferase